MASLQLAAGIALGSLAAVWAGATVLERSTDRLADHYGLPESVRGAVVAALGSSFPEFAAAFTAVVIHDRVVLAVGIVVGSAVFNVLVVPAVSALLSTGSDLRTDAVLVYKEAGFYLLAVAVLLLTFAMAVIYEPAGPRTGTLTRALAAAPLGLYK